MNTPIMWKINLKPLIIEKSVQLIAWFVVIEKFSNDCQKSKPKQLQSQSKAQAIVLSISANHEQVEFMK